MRFYTKQHPFYCGIDLHARTMYVCILSQDGEIVLHRNMPASPDALLKVYVTASAEERARRRYKQLIEKGNPVTLAGLLREIQERDARDSARAAAPLRTAADAIVLDTTDMSIDASVAFVLDRFRALRAHSER